MHLVNLESDFLGRECSFFERFESTICLRMSKVENTKNGL